MTRRSGGSDPTGRSPRCELDEKEPLVPVSTATAHTFGSADIDTNLAEDLQDGSEGVVNRTCSFDVAQAPDPARSADHSPSIRPVNMSSAIEHRIDPRDRRVGTGWVRRLLPYRTRRMVGPFIYADVIGPETLASGSGIDVDAHPHIGLSTVTYLFDGRLVHRDSTGAAQAIEPGAVNWMTAGSGVTHTERSHPDDLASSTNMFGLQTWVALPIETEEVEPSFHHAAAVAVPTETIGKSSVRVAAGSGWGLESPVTGSSPLVLAELTLDSESAIPIEVNLPELAVIAIRGDLRINDEPVASGQIAVLSPKTVATVVGSGTAVVLGGEPVGDRTIWWNFVHSDTDRIEQAKTEWVNQLFPRVPNDHDPYVPLPTS